MREFKCLQCSGVVRVSEAATEAVCPQCGARQPVPKDAGKSAVENDPFWDERAAARRPEANSVFETEPAYIFSSFISGVLVILGVLGAIASVFVGIDARSVVVFLGMLLNSFLVMAVGLILARSRDTAINTWHIRQKIK